MPWVFPEWCSAPSQLPQGRLCTGPLPIKERAFVFTYQGTGFRLSTVGLILMIAGAFGFVVSAIVFATSRRQVGTGTHSMDREVTDSEGRSSSVHEERT